MRNVHVFVVTVFLNSNFFSIMVFPEVILDMDVDGWKSLDGFKPFYHVLKQNQLMYTPVGHVMVERSLEGTMIYGVRKSYIFAGNASLSEYGQCLALFAKGNNAERMQQVHDALKAATAKLKQA